LEDHALLDALTALPPSQVVKPALHLMKHFALAPILLSIVTLPLRILLAILTFITTNVWLKLATALAELLTLEPSLPSLATATLTALTPELVSLSRELDLLATIPLNVVMSMLTLLGLTTTLVKTTFVKNP